jgi:hypothetical protein
MKTIILAVALFSGIALTTSCSNKAKIVKLNNTLITAGDSLKSLAEKWSETVKGDSPATGFSNLTPIRKSMQSYISRKKDEINGLEDMGGSEKFKKAVLNFLTVEEGAAKSMESFEGVNANTSQADLQKIGTELQAVSTQEAPAMAEVNKEQALFAKENNIQLINRR